jgi:hypothetical protein
MIVPQAEIMPDYVSAARIVNRRAKKGASGSPHILARQ